MKANGKPRFKFIKKKTHSPLTKSVDSDIKIANESESNEKQSLMKVIQSFNVGIKHEGKDRESIRTDAEGGIFHKTVSLEDSSRSVSREKKAARDLSRDEMR